MITFPLGRELRDDESTAQPQTVLRGPPEQQGHHRVLLPQVADGTLAPADALCPNRGPNDDHIWRLAGSSYDRKGYLIHHYVCAAGCGAAYDEHV